MFQIEVFDAFQTRFGPSKRNPKLKMKKTSLEVLNIICPSSTVHTKIDQSNFIASSHRRARDPPRSQSLGSRMDRRCCYRRDRMGELPEIGLQPCAAPEQRGTEGASGGKSGCRRCYLTILVRSKQQKSSRAPGCLRRNMDADVGDDRF